MNLWRWQTPPSAGAKLKGRISVPSYRCERVTF
jgi:hypothetical protein